MNKAKKIFVTLPFDFKEARELLCNSGFEVVINEELPLERDVFLRESKGCHGIICYPNQKIDKEFLDFVGDQLKVICTNSVGYDHIDLRECEKRNIKIGYCPNVVNVAVAEFTIGLLINVARRISEGIEFYKRNEMNSYWKESFLLGKNLEGAVIGILGLGRIGMSIATRLRGFEVKQIIYHNRNRRTEADNLGYEYVSFDDLLMRSDFIICSCSLNKDSEQIFNRKAFEKMKSSAIFINVARGDCIDQDDLFNALKTNRILAADLDVTSPQPLPPNHKLFTLENCFITPYLSSAEEKSRGRMSLITAKNLINGLKDQDLLYPLNYREQ
ncbi:unnamed protein product [Brachionus calyciflorus]|uniref:Glyoxylate reductase/hydroxypyruvate reductase n=1 Tax=Brachionus calyciflorus TaxID=104777 RepID=A0A813PHW7_9BILA|nr:unnamed protein product [Brachionus calyciflorus]